MITKLLASADNIAKPRIIFCRDTRDSSPHLLAIIQSGLKLFSKLIPNAPIPEFKIVGENGLSTTPQAHFYVLYLNQGLATERDDLESLYFSKFGQAFLDFLEIHKKKCNSEHRHNLQIDGANGVGGVCFKKFLPYLNSALITGTLVNDGSTEHQLNTGCGSDFVKTTGLPPKLFGNESDLTPSVHYASFDGDADRLIYYCSNDSNPFRLLDGDSIAILYAEYVKEQLGLAGLLEDISLGVVQTAYANGSLTRHITEDMVYTI